MNEFLSIYQSVLYRLTGMVYGNLEFWACVGLTVFLGGLIYNGMIHLFGDRDHGFWLNTLVAGVGLFVISLVATLAVVWVPQETQRELGAWFLPAAAVAGSLVVVIPMTSRWSRMGYFSGLLTWSASLGSVLAIIFLLGAFSDVVVHSRHNALKIKIHNVETRSMLDR